MSTKSLLILFGILLIFGVTLSIYFGLTPKPIEKIKMSSFESPAKLALAVELRMNEEFKTAPIIAFGYQPERPQQIEIIKAWMNERSPRTWVADENLNLTKGFEQVEMINSKNQIETLAESLQKSVDEKRQVAIILPAVYSSQILSASIASQLKKKFHLPITSFTVVELPRIREEEGSVLIPCRVTDDTIGTGPLGCAILQQARMLYRKKSDPEKHIGLMDQRGETDFLIFFSN